MQPAHESSEAMTILGQALANGDQVATINCPRGGGQDIMVCQNHGQVTQLINCPALAKFARDGGRPLCKLLLQNRIGYNCPLNGAPTLPK